MIFIIAIENKLKQATYKWKDGRKDILQECTYVGSLLECLHINKSMKKIGRYIDKPMLFISNDIMHANDLIVQH